MPHADLFQMLVAIPNAGKEDLWEHVPDVLAELDKYGVKVKGKRKPLIAEGRRLYLLRLGERGRHHLAGARRVAQLYHAYPAIPYTRAKHANRVRDFFHDCYYAAFYLARWALVSHGQHDCSQHKDMGKVLGTRLKEPTIRNKVQTTQRKLEELQASRNDADYIMHAVRLAQLASPQLIDLHQAEVEGLYTSWGIP